MAELTVPGWDYGKALDREIERLIVGSHLEVTEEDVQELRAEYRRMIGPLPPEFSMTAEWNAGQAAPLSCDLTGDKIACAILRAWARQPWEPVHRAALLDRMEELGFEEPAKAWREIQDTPLCEAIRITKRFGTRTRVALLLKQWRRTLIQHFGDFESKYSTP